MKKIRAGIFGGSGYGGSELLRILLQHPEVEISAVYANEHAGKPIGNVHKNLYGLTDLIFEPIPDDLSDLSLDVIFLALPHGHAMRLVKKIPEKIKIIDLSGDFRLNRAESYVQFYGWQHEAIELQKEFVYGLSETNRQLIKSCERVANPGCFATAVLLALAPLVREDLIDGHIVVDAKTGSSGSGAKPSEKTHHPERVNSFYAYKPFRHQHQPEIEQHLDEIGEYKSSMTFITQSMPVSRGIFACCYLETKYSISNIREVYEHFYQKDFFIRIVDESPDINWVKNTNFCDIAVHSNGKRVVVFSAIDNLVKGAAGQAVQNMNLMFGLDEREGLMLLGSRP